MTQILFIEFLDRLYRLGYRSTRGRGRGRTRLPRQLGGFAGNPAFGNPLPRGQGSASSFRAPSSFNNNMAPSYYYGAFSTYFSPFLFVF